jgi:hypothetical protein
MSLSFYHLKSYKVIMCENLLPLDESWAYFIAKHDLIGLCKISNHAISQIICTTNCPKGKEKKKMPKSAPK